MPVFGPKGREFDIFLIGPRIYKSNTLIAIYIFTMVERILICGSEPWEMTKKNSKHNPSHRIGLFETNMQNK